MVEGLAKKGRKVRDVECSSEGKWSNETRQDKTRPDELDKTAIFSNFGEEDASKMQQEVDGQSINRSINIGRKERKR